MGKVRTYADGLVIDPDDETILPVRFGSGKDYTLLNTDGHISYEGHATTWEDANFDPTMLTGVGTVPAATTFSSTGCVLAGFQKNQNDSVRATIEYPHKAKLNAVGETTVTLSFHGHAYPTTTLGGNVRFKLEYLFTKEGQALTTSTIIYVTVAMPTTAWEKASFEFADIPAPTELGEQFLWTFTRLSNDPLDTYAGTVAIATIGFHYETDAPGSKERITK